MEERITRLEVKLSFAEDLLDELNHTVYRQQQQIEALQKHVRALTEQVRAGAGGGGGSGEPRDLREEIPPHY
ncbi:MULTISPECIES: SlyX family protein [Niveibacterium]|uniref:SlyX family protein n=1 Tax=Niveibacterium microcysteis TaxID=2811415 RepID=A0ABX7M933_9RHOO|nr:MULTISPECIES: SlyX family protein [Niveibacterium]QSI77179.1 SlyX family protein [Niveibacterium microcysteis]